MLRYLVLLVAGGVYSDADTRALMPLAHWADGSEPFRIPTRYSARPSAAAPHLHNKQHLPIRMIVSIEGDFHIWRDRVSL